MASNNAKPRRQELSAEDAAGALGAVKKADRKVRPPGDVRAPGHDHFVEYIAVLLISDSKRREVRSFVSVTVRAHKGRG